MPDEKGITRRERNERVGESAPVVDVPPYGWHLWQWYWTLSARVLRVRDGVCVPLAPSEFLAWCQASGTIVSAPEYDILCAMDDAFCEEMNSELRDFRTRQEEEQKKQVEAAKSKRGRR